MRVLPEHERGLARMMADGGESTYLPLRTLVEAQAYPDGAVVLEGDWGGQIYLTCPARLVRCTEAELFQLCADIDRLEWECNGGQGSRVFYERLREGSAIGGGMGGGVLTDDLWCHQDLIDVGLDVPVREVIEGRSSLLVIPTHDEIFERANSGDRRAQFKLGRDFAWTARNYPPDLDNAVYWLQLAARQGHLTAQLELASVLESKWDGAGAAYWYTQFVSSAEPRRGKIRAMCQLGRLYREGKMLPADPAKAYHWYLTAEQLQPSSYLSVVLGEMALRGEGRPADLEAARKRFKRAVHCGDADGYYWMGVSYSESFSDERTMTRSIRWFKRAAFHRSQRAMIELGRIFQQGLGVERNLVVALAWYILASLTPRMEPPIAFAIDRVKAQLTEQQQADSLAFAMELSKNPFAVLHLRHSKGDLED